MEHPLIGNIDNLTMDELQTKITELNKKLMIAHRSGNGYLTQQVQMALETFQNKLRERQEAEWERQRKSGTDFADKIDIS